MPAMELVIGLIQKHSTLAAGLLFTLLTVLPYLWLQRRRSEKVRRDIVHAGRLGLDEPVTIHPKVDRGRCIGSGACVKACPEKTVLGMVDNKSMTVCASQCVGHGACARACPVGAIELVFGSERRGVDIPQVRPNFESNVPRLYIAGELGGMGLIKNAVTQGWQAAGYLARDLREKPFRRRDCHDVVIVGAGPAGLSASLQAKKEGLNFVTIEREQETGGAILSYPRAKVVMTSPFEAPLFGKVREKEMSKERLIALWDEIMRRTSLKVSLGETVIEAERNGEIFTVRTNRRELTCRYLLLCVGRRGSPRKLGVPGEKSPKVMYRLLEPERFAGNQTLVVGGGDSAVEAALALASQKDAQTILSYRGEAFSRVKPANRERLEKAVRAGRLRVILKSNVTEIRDGMVRLTRENKTLDVPNDFVFIFAGGVAPNDFLEKVGVIMETKYGAR